MKTPQTEQLWKAIQDHRRADTLKALIYARVFGMFEERKAITASDFFEVVAEELNTWDKITKV